MVNKTFYLVDDSICERCGLKGKRYMTEDGRYVLDDKDLRRVNMTAAEYIHGLKGVSKVDEDTARLLIAQGGYRMKEEDNKQNQEE